MQPINDNDACLQVLVRHAAVSGPELRRLIRRKEIALGGNVKLNIYGTLHCRSGKRMKKENRVFFRSPAEAIQGGFRPCGHCLPRDYKNWKNGLI
jgi:hypothetical protein